MSVFDTTETYIYMALKDGTNQAAVARVSTLTGLTGTFTILIQLSIDYIVIDATLRLTVSVVHIEGSEIFMIGNLFGSFDLVMTRINYAASTQGRHYLQCF